VDFERVTKFMIPTMFTSFGWLLARLFASGIRALFEVVVNSVASTNG